MSIEIDNNEIIVKVGEVIHPMEEDHYITWVSLVSDNEIFEEYGHITFVEEDFFCICNN